MSAIVFLSCARGRVEVDEKMYTTITGVPGVIRAVAGPVSANDRLYCMVVSIEDNKAEMGRTLERLRSVPGIGSVIRYEEKAAVAQ